MNDFLQQVEILFEQGQKFSYAHSEWIYLVIGIVFFVLFLGAIFDKTWAIDPESNAQRFFYQTFGHTAFRIIILFVYILGWVAGFGMFFLYYLK